MENAPEKCILCGSPNREPLIRKESWQVYRCTECNLGFLDPRPSEADLQKLYQNEYFNENYDGGIEPGTDQFKKRLSGEDHRVRFIRSVKPSGRLLDIGCGYGYFPAACRESGYDVQGMDISDWAARYAIERLNIPVTIGQLEHVSLPPEYFDIITMWHFLEHTRNPVQTLLRAKQWLKKDGFMVIDVPNYAGTDATKEWDNWVGWQLPYHFYHFTPESLNGLLKKCGFRVIKSKDYHSEAIKQSLKKIPVVSIFSRLIAKFYSGTSLAVIAVLEK